MRTVKVKKYWKYINMPDQTATGAAKMKPEPVENHQGHKFVLRWDPLRWFCKTCNRETGPLIVKFNYEDPWVELRPMAPKCKEG